MHAQIQIILSERGGGSKPNGEKTALVFYVCFGFCSPKFSGDAGRGPTIYEGGGGVQMLISIEFDRTCDLPGMGSEPPTPPPPSGFTHA